MVAIADHATANASTSPASSTGPASSARSTGAAGPADSGKRDIHHKRDYYADAGAAGSTNTDETAMNWPLITDSFLAIVVAVCIIYEAVVVIATGDADSISWEIYQASIKRPFVPFAAGFLCGHLFGQFYWGSTPPAMAAFAGIIHLAYRIYERNQPAHAA